MWLELLSALAFDGMTPSSVPLYGGGGGMTPSSVPLYGGGGGMTPSSVPLYGGGGGMTPSSVPLYGGGGGMTPSSVPLYGGGGGMTPSSVPLYGGGDGMTPVTSAQNLQSFVQFALSLLDHIKSIRLSREVGEECFHTISCILNHFLWLHGVYIVHVCVCIFACVCVCDTYVLLHVYNYVYGIVSVPDACFSKISIFWIL